MKKKLLAAGGLGLVVVALAVLALALADRDAWIASYKDKASAQASEDLGRALEVGAVETSLFPFGATVRDIKLAGPTPASSPQLRLAELQVRFQLLGAILSFGQRLEVSSLSLRGLRARAARDAEGRWDFDDILARLAQGPKDDKPTDLSFLDGARIARVTLDDAKIELSDAALGRPLVIDALALALEDIRLGAPLTARASARLVDGASASPVTLALTLAALPKTLSFDPVPAIDASFKLAKVELAPWGSLFPKGAIAPAGGTLDVDASAQLGVDLATLQTRGKASARGLKLRGPRGPAAAADLDLAWDLSRDESGRLEVRAASLKGAGVDLAATLTAARLSLAGIERADAKLSVVDLATVLKLIPPGADLVPAELSLDGPLNAALSGDPAAGIALSFDLDRARVRYGETIDKPKGRALHAKLNAKRAGALLEVKPIAIAIDTARVSGEMSLPIEAGGAFTASLKSGKVALSSLKAMIPPFAKALKRGDKVEGEIAFAASASPEQGQQRLNAALTLMGLDVGLKGLSARGNAVLRTHLKPAGDKLGIELVLDAEKLALSSIGDDGEKVLDKAAGTPLNLDVILEKKGNIADFSRAELVVGETRLKGTGRVSALDQEPQLDLDLGSVDLRFDDLRRAIPGADSLPAGGRLKSAVRLRGPASASGLAATLTGVDARFGSSRLKGKLELKRLSPIELDADFSEVELRAGDLFSLSDSLRSLPADARFSGGVKAKGKLDRTFSAELNAKAIEIGGSSLRGTVALRDLDRPQIQFDLNGDQVDIDAFMDAFPDDEDAGKAGTRGDENPHGLSPGARRNLATISGAGTLRAKRVIFEGLPMTDFVGKLKMTNGKVSFEALDFNFYKGRVTAAGTQLDLPAERTGYKLNLGVKRLDLNAVLAAHTGVPAVFKGLVDKVVNVSGRGLSKADLIASLDGPVDVSAGSLGLARLDILGGIFAPLAAAATKQGKSAGLKKPADTSTTLRDLKAAFQLGQGRAQLTKAVTTPTGFGALKLDGGFKLDQSLDLRAVAALSPDTIARWTGGKVKPAGAVDVPFKITGTWAAPRLTGVDVGALIGVVLGGVAVAAVDAATGGAGTRVKEQASAAVDDTKERVEAAAKKAEADARRAASDARKKAEDAAKKAADDAKRKAKAAAKKAADAAKKKAEDEARKRLFGK